MRKNLDPIMILSSLAAILLMSFLFLFVGSSRPSEFFKKIGGQIPTNQISKETTVFIDYGDGNIRKFEGLVSEETRVWDLFQQAIAVGGIDVEISDHFIPERIDGFKNGTNGKHWSLYLNNIKQNLIPFEIIAKPGDEVLFRFE
jgi:hypothetical protein